MPLAPASGRQMGLLLLTPFFGLVLIAALWAGLALQIRSEREAKIAASMRDVAYYTAAFEEHVRRTLREYDRTLEQLKIEIERTGQVDLLRLQQLGIVRDGEINAINVTDETGRVIASNRNENRALRLGEREFFRQLAAADTGGMLIAKPVMGQRARAPIIALVRRFNHSDGSFAGIVVASLRPDQFTNFFMQSDLGTHGIIGVLGLDGVYRARRVGAADRDDGVTANEPIRARAMRMPHDVFVGASPFDQQERIVAYRRMDDYPLVVMAVHSTEEALAELAAGRTFYLALGAATTAVLLAFFGLLTWALQRLRRNGQRLRTERQFLRSLLDNIPTGISVRRLSANGDGEYLVWNETNALLYGVDPAHVVGKPVGAVVSAAEAERVRAWDRALLASPGIQDFTERTRLPNGDHAQIHRIRAPIFDATDEVEYVITVSEDVTRRNAAEDELRLASKVFETTADAIVITDADDRVIKVNAAFTSLTGYGADEMLGRALSTSAFAPLDPDAFALRMQNLHRTGVVAAAVARRHKLGHALELWVTASLVRDEAGDIANYVRIFTDITPLKEAQKQLEQLANFDTLTGLPNRRLFNDRLDGALARARRQDANVGLMFLDLDGFKNINDTYGHDVGDELLQQTAIRLAGCVRASDSLCRLGGDEFTIVFEHAAVPDHAEFIARRIANELCRPFHVKDHALEISASIGIALFPAHGTTAIELMSRADAAMYQAKQAGGNRHAFHGPASGSLAAGAPGPSATA